MQGSGRLNGPRTERSYRSTLERHAADAEDRAVGDVVRDDVKRTLRRWPKPNTHRVNRSILVSFYDWTMEEGLRLDNPARQTPRPKRQPTQVYRLTRDEASGMLAAAATARERRAIHIGICAGLRNAELRGLQGRHFGRPGFVWVSADIAKGGRELWVPVIEELRPVTDELSQLPADHYVLPRDHWADPPFNTRRFEIPTKPSSSQALRTLVMTVGLRSGIRAHIHPHLMRHAYGDHVARYAGIRNAQFLLGHADVGTTEIYMGDPTLDELAASVAGMQFAEGGESRPMAR
jgi:integrase